MKPFKVVVLLISALALSACGIKNRSSNNDTPSGNVPSTSVPTEHSAISGAIGPSGGTVKDPENNLTINIPSGALSSETNITATYIESPEILSNKISADFLGAAEFGPDGTVFAKPVQVTINLNKTPNNSSLAVFCYSPQDDVWEYVTDATPNGNKATFEVTHFSKYQVMNRTGEFLNEYTNMVNHAQVNGLSDSEVIEAFRDYLVNEKHVMDQYTTYDGYWYEPCGLKINGQYQINGKSGDPEALSHREGESNKVGNAYGLSKIDGATSNKQGVKGASSSSEMYDVTVIVEYKIITPDIELSASKKKLKKGESATISIRCHYTNAQNFYPEFKDLDLAGYMLTIAKPTHFSTDKSVVLTSGSGRASFVVTALENNKAETITVNFDVAGDFGTHSEGNITLNSEGKTINGHIKQEKTLTYGFLTAGTGYTVDYHQEGYFQMVFEYDFEGNITEDEDTINGNIQISNVSLTLVTEHLLADLIYDGVPVTANDMDFFNEKNSPTVYEPEISFVAVKNNDTEVSVLGTSFDKIAEITGSYFLEIKSLLPQNYGKVSSHSEIPFHITILAGTVLLLPFDLVTGEYTSSSASLKDTAEIIFGEEGGANEPFETLINRENIILSQSEETTQTITVA